MLRRFSNTFAFENFEGIELIRSHNADGYTGLIPLSDLLILLDAINATIDDYTLCGYSDDDDVRRADYQRYQEYLRECKEAAGKQIAPARENGKKNDDLYIIFDLDAQAVKVGRSINPAARLKTLSIATPHTLKLCRVYLGAGEKEEAAHKALNGMGLYISPEWFEFRDSIFDTIAEVCKGHDVICYERWNEK